MPEGSVQVPAPVLLMTARSPTLIVAAFSTSAAIFVESVSPVPTTICPSANAVAPNTAAKVEATIFFMSANVLY